MKRSAPIHYLKRQARILSRTEHIPLHAALDRMAAGQGFDSWSLFAASHPTPASEIFARLDPGNLVLIAARPGHGKTIMALELAREAMKAGHRGMFFTLEYSERECLDRFAALRLDRTRLAVDVSDDISADHIVDALKHAPRGTLAVIDYLQLLDQKRETPDLATQVRKLKSFAQARRLTLVFVSQIDRSYDASKKSCPDEHDVRLPNPLDLSLFDKRCFLNGGDMRFHAAT